MQNQRLSDHGPAIIILDRNPERADRIIEGFSQFPISGAEIKCLNTITETVNHVGRGSVDIVLVDLATLGETTDQQCAQLSRLSRKAGGALMIALSEGTSVSSAVTALQSGAHDVLPISTDPHTLFTRLSELGHRHGKARALGFEQANAQSPRVYEGFVGGSEQMQAVYDQIDRIAQSSAPVFITGESGTGKDVCASALHTRGARKDGAFIALNCGAIPRDLMEAELFGAAKGAYSGAHADRKGAVQLADGGILFLDEIGEMDLGLQSKLLRFLQTGMFNRVGDPLGRRVDVRVICATNKNPMQLIQEKKFREDLFYRLHVLPLHLPPLRQRPTDILPLARTFLAQFAAEEHKHFTHLSSSVEDMLVAREWPGNVRQLQNLVRRIAVMFDGREVTADMLVAADIEGKGQSHATSTPIVARNKTSIRPLWQQEKDIIESAINQCQGNIAQAAAALEISPSTIYRKRQQWDEFEALSAAPRRTAAA